MNEVLIVFIRSVSIYLFIILAIRFFGKKELAQLSVIDLVFILLISNAVQPAMVGENSTLWGGFIAATSLFIANYLLKNLFFKSKKVSQFFQGTPLVLIYNGKPLLKNLDEAKMSPEELNAAVREHGIEKISEVDLAVLEVDGNISVLFGNFQKKSVKRRKAHKIISKTT